MCYQRTPGGDRRPLIGIEVAGQYIRHGSAWIGGSGGEAELTDQSRFDLQHFANEVIFRIEVSVEPASCEAGLQLTNESTRLGRAVLFAVTLMLSGRAMTIVFIGDVGCGVGDPPSAWLMPLVGDAVIGVTSLIISYLIARGSGLGAWTAIAVWNAIGIWDALSAFLVHQSVPWPDFFMVELFGSWMFLAAVALHLLCLWLVTRRGVREYYLNPA
jgi:hypothetical protein